MKGEAMDIHTIPAGRELDALVAEKVMGIGKLEFDAYYGPQHRYSTDIAAAWEVVEKLAKPLKVVWTGKVWVCEVFGEPCSQEAGTAPLAICRAALKVMDMESQ